MRRCCGIYTNCVEAFNPCQNLSPGVTTLDNMTDAITEKSPNLQENADQASLSGVLIFLEYWFQIYAQLVWLHAFFDFHREPFVWLTVSLMFKVVAKSGRVQNTIRLPGWQTVSWKKLLYRKEVLKKTQQTSEHWYCPKKTTMCFIWFDLVVCNLSPRTIPEPTTGFGALWKLWLGGRLSTGKGTSQSKQTPLILSDKLRGL